MPHTRPLQLRIALAFVGLILGFVGTAIYVPLALRPSVERAESIQKQRADAVRALDEVRDAARQLRAATVLTYYAQWDRSLARDEHARTVAVARDRLRAATAEYSRLPKPPEGARTWKQLADIHLPALYDAVEATAAASSRPGGDPAVFQRLLEGGAFVDRVLEHLEDINAGAAHSDAERIHAHIRRLGLGYVALAALGGAGALFLLFQTLALFRGYASAAERRVSELGAFAGQVAHDLRSPLQTIQLTVTGIERKAQDESLRRLAARASAGVGRLDGMIRDLLQFARSGAAIEENAHADVDAVLQDVRDEFHPVAERAGVVLTVTAAPDVHARIAAVALKAIVANLVENAIKYRRPEGDRSVHVGVTTDKGHVVLAVKDDGVGIPPAITPRLFDPFFRGSKRSDSYGLGLATVKRLVESHQGTIAVESEEGRGSTFSVALRRAEPPDDSQDRRAA
jgi:signal transduction histidine kinase